MRKEVIFFAEYFSKERCDFRGLRYTRNFYIVVSWADIFAQEDLERPLKSLYLSIF